MAHMLDQLLVAIDELPEPSWAEGRASGAAVTIAIPGRDSCAISDPGLVEWLRVRSEDAPFGDRKKTRRDPEIRSTLRLRARGKATIGGLALDAIVADIEQVFAPDYRLTA